MLTKQHMPWYVCVCAFFFLFFFFLQVEGSYVLTSGDLASSPMVRRLVTNMMNSTLRKLEVSGLFLYVDIFVCILCVGVSEWVGACVRVQVWSVLF